MRRCAECFKEIADKKAKCSACGFDNSNVKAVAGAIKSGRLIDERYHIGSVLGQGGFGITYKALDVDLDRVLAIKEYYPKNSVQRSEDGFTVQPADKAEFSKGLKAFTDEAKALAKFQGHSNIVSVQNYFRSNNTAYMVMEFMEGRTVREILRGGKSLPTADSVKIILGVLEGLNACHRQNLIHRDLTPDNVYITTSSKVKILDFGSARQTKEGEDNEFTQILKESYAPIEQYQKSGAQGPYTDIYSVGATFYRLLSGKPPPDNATDRIIEDKLKRPSQVNPNLDISVEVEDVLMKAMAVKPNDRYQTVELFKNDLISAVNNPNPKKAKYDDKSSKTEPVIDKKVNSISKSKVKEKPPGSKQIQTPEIKEKTSKPSKEQQSQLRQQTQPQDENKKPPVAALVGLAAALVLFVGYQILNPTADDPLDELAIQEIVREQKPKETSTTIYRQSEIPNENNIIDIEQNVNKSLEKEPDSIKEEPKRLANIDKYELKVNVYPDNVRSVVKILETKDPYSYGQILNEGKYTIQVSANGYRTQVLRNTNLNRNRTIDVELQKLFTPTVSALNDFYDLFTNPSKSASDKYAINHKRFAPLNQIFEITNRNVSVHEELKRLAKNGDAESNFILGVALVEGIFLDSSRISQAKKHLQAAYDQDYKAASVWLAKAYSCSLSGNSPGCDEKKAIEILEEASFEVPLSDYIHAKILLNQNNNLSKSLRLAESASNAGVIEATYLMGDLALKSGDLSRGKEYWQLAADQGNTSAMVRLASLESRDMSGTSIQLLRKAYENGDKQAGIFLAIEAADRNPSSFFNLSRNLSNENISDGYFLTGWAHLKGVGTKLDLKTSLKNFSSCKDLNCEVMASIVSYKNSSSKKPITEYISELKKYTDKKNIDSLLPDVKGELYLELGKASLKDNKNDSRNGISFLEQSVQFKNVNALEQLCIKVYRGKGVTKDDNSALDYCTRASEAGSVNSLTHLTIGDLLSKGVGQRRGQKPMAQIKAAYTKACDLNDGLGCCNLAKIYHTENNSKQRNESINLASKNNFFHCKQIIGIE